MILRAAIVLILMLAAPLAAETDPAAAASAAAERLDKAARQLEEADTARNRVKALTETIHAYEDGLLALREGLRRAAIREEAVTRELRAQEEEIARLLGVLQTMGGTPSPVLLLHPSGPVGTARSGMIVSEIAPALNRSADALRVRLEEVSTLRLLQQNAADHLQVGLSGVQAARTELSKAIADRTELPRRFTEDPVRTALLIASTETLEGFASGLSEIAIDEAEGSLPGISHRKGSLPMPVRGRILRRAGEADAAGITRPGLVVATRPHALVTTPAAATVRYRGPLLDYGNVMILEPEAGLLLVFAGLETVYGRIGEVLPGGSPVGLMAGPTLDAGVILSQTGGDESADFSETLYIEVRENKTPVNPESWFETDKDN